jgi:glutaredoxin
MTALPIFFGSSECPSCQAQKEFLKNKLENKDYMYYNIDKLSVPDFITEQDGSYSVPTWWIPKKVLNGKPHGKLITGVIKGLPKPLPLPKLMVNKFKFGKKINTLAKYGKNFPDGKGLSKMESWETIVKKKYGGDGLMSIPFGGKFNEDNKDVIFENDY